jgi:hypothetical protein
VWSVKRKGKGRYGEYAPGMSNRMQKSECECERRARGIEPLAGWVIGSYPVRTEVRALLLSVPHLEKLGRRARGIEPLAGIP